MSYSLLLRISDTFSAGSAQRMAVPSRRFSNNVLHESFSNMWSFAMKLTWCSKSYGMDCLFTDSTHAQRCDNVYVQSADT